MTTRFLSLRKLAGLNVEDESEVPEGEEQEEEEPGEVEEEPGEVEEEQEEEEEGQPSAPPADTATAAQAATAAEARRWASVLASDAADGRLELATSLLAEGVDEGKQLSADAIIRNLGFAGQDKQASMRNRLSTTPQHKLGGNAPKGEGKDGSAASESRKKATAGVNRRVAKSADTTNGKERVGARAGKKED